MAAATPTRLIANRSKVEGTRQEIDRGIAWLRRRGAAPTPIEKTVIE